MPVTQIGKTPKEQQMERKVEEIKGIMRGTLQREFPQYDIKYIEGLVDKMMDDINNG